MIKTIAIYSLYGSGEHIREVDDWIENDDDYTRLTDDCVVEFSDLDRGEIVAKQVKCLNKRKEEIRAEMTKRISTVDDQIQRLMAIEHHE